MEENNAEPILQTNIAELKLANDSQATSPELSQDKVSQVSEKIQTVEKLVDQKPKGPAEAFKAQEIAFHELSTKVGFALHQLDSIHEFTNLAKEKILITNSLLIKQGQSEVIKILFDAYNSVFRSSLVASRAKQDSKPFELILGELRSDLRTIDIEVINPEINSKIDETIMKVNGTVKPTILHKDKTVKSVEKCGFLSGNKVIQKAEVILYKKD